MLHLFENNNTDIVAADTKEQARDYFIKSGGLTGEDVGVAGDWLKMDDDKLLTVHFEDAPANAPKKVTQTCKEWAAGESKPNLVSTTNY